MDIKERNRQYYKKNKKKIKERNRQNHINNRERILKRMKQYVDDNKEKITEQRKQHYIENSERIKEEARQYRINNSEQLKQYRIKNRDRTLIIRKQYMQTRKGKASQQKNNAKRQAREQEIINTLTAEEWIDILKEYKFRCAYCGKEFTLFDRETRDHVIPISKGGDNTKENVVPACRSCNSQKSNKMIYTKETG